MKALLMTNNAAVTEFGVSISPSSFVERTTNGGYRTPKFTCNVSGGVGPFEYLWTSDGLNIDSPTSQKTSFTTTGYNDYVLATAYCEVTDTGNGNQKLSAFVTIEIEFGSLQ